MFGAGSLPLIRVFGIRIGVNASWFLVLFLFIFLLSDSFAETLGDETAGYLTAVVAALLFFGSIVLHELGHALAARREGIGVAGIDLFFFGGVMKMSQDTTSPGAEFRVAVAGPLVTLVIVGLAALGGLALVGGDFIELARLDGEAGAAGVLVAFLFSMNVVLLLFNLIPAFPLDGGRIARAVAWRVTGDRVRATRFAAAIGQGFAVLLMGYGLYLLIFGSATVSGLWLLVLGWLLGQSARGAVAQTAVTARLEGITVADVMDAEPVTIPAELPAGRAWEEYFLRYQGWPWFAVVEADGRYVGVAGREAVQDAAPARPVGELARAGEPDARIRDDAPLEALLGSEDLRRLGAVMAVDAEGRLRGVVTREQVARALNARLAPAR
jgi:Zn-dependent protease